MMLPVHRYTLSSKVLMEVKSALILPSSPEQKTGCVYLKTGYVQKQILVQAGLQQELSSIILELHVTSAPCTVFSPK